jgi:hypothetical protein
MSSLTVTVAATHVTSGSATFLTTTANGFSVFRNGQVVTFSTQSGVSYKILAMSGSLSGTLTSNYGGTTSTTATTKLTDNGISSYVGPAGSKASSATILSVPDTSHGTYGGNLAAVRTPAVATNTSVSTFKMTGYFASTNTWETWMSTGSPNITPPSGHTLTFITYVVTSGAAN